jgi:hypothetical protein
MHAGQEPTMTTQNLSFPQSRWLRYAAMEHRALQAGREYVPQTMPTRTRDALIGRGLMARHVIEGLGGGFTYYRITDEGLAAVDAMAAAAQR